MKYVTENLFLEQLSTDENIKESRHGLLLNIAKAIRGENAAGYLLDELRVGAWFKSDFDQVQPVDFGFQKYFPNSLGRLVQLFASMSRDKRPFGRPVGYGGRVDQLGSKFIECVQSFEWKQPPSDNGNRQDLTGDYQVGGPALIYAFNSEGQIKSDRVMRLELTNSDDIRLLSMSNIGLAYLADGFDRTNGVLKFKKAYDQPLVSVLGPNVRQEVIDSESGNSLYYRLILKR